MKSANTIQSSFCRRGRSEPQRRPLQPSTTTYFGNQARVLYLAHRFHVSFHRHLAQPSNRGSSHAQQPPRLSRHTPSNHLSSKMTVPVESRGVWVTKLCLRIAQFVFASAIISCIAYLNSSPRPWGFPIPLFPCVSLFLLPSNPPVLPSS